MPRLYRNFLSKNRKGRLIAALSQSGLLPGLEDLNVLGLPALGALGHFELHGLAFLQALEAARLDGREMHEDIFAILAADESEALGVIKPLHCSLFHFVVLFFALNFAVNLSRL